MSLKFPVRFMAYPTPDGWGPPVNSEAHKPLIKA